MVRLSFGLLFVPSLVFAEPITAQVIDGVTMEPVAGAKVTAGARSTTSGVDGTFVIDASEVTVSADGYESSTEVVTNGMVVLFRVGALSEVIEIEQRAPRRDATLLARDEIRYQPGGGADGLAAVRGLPGVGVAPPTAGGRLVIRGGAPEDSSLSIDGVPVPFIYHSFNNTTILPVSMIGAIAFLPGGFGVDEGRATAGVVAITTDDAPVTKTTGEASASFTEASALLAVPLAKHIGLRTGVRRSTVDLIAPVAIPEDLMIGFTTPPRFYDAFLQLEARGAADRVALLGFTSYDRIGIVNSDPISDLPSELSVTGRFGRLIATWKHDGARFDNRLVAALGADSWDTTLEAGQYLHAKHALAMVRDDAVFELSKRIALRTGFIASIEHYEIDARTFSLPSEGLPAERLDDLEIRDVDERYDANLAAAYAAIDLRASEHATVTSGVRVEHYGHTRQTRVMPRLQLVYARGPMTLRGALGVYARDLDGLEGVSTKLVPETAVQTTAGIDVALGEGITAGLAGFTTKRRDLVVEDPMIEGNLPYRSGAHGRSHGAEVLLRYRRGDTFAWLAYTFSRSERDDGPLSVWRSTASDQPHVFTALASTRRGPWRFGARWQLSSGVPYTDVVGATYIPEADRHIPTLGAPFGARYPTSHQLDLRVERTWHRRAYRIIGFVDVANTYRNGRVVRYQYDPSYSMRTPIEDMIPLPSVGVRVEK